MNLLDIFSGIGAFSLGLERAGFKTVAFCERLSSLTGVAVRSAANAEATVRDSDVIGTVTTASQPLYPLKKLQAAPVFPQCTSRKKPSITTTSSRKPRYCITTNFESWSQTKVQSATTPSRRFGVQVMRIGFPCSTPS